MICLSESSRERVEVSHVIIECRVINHHPKSCVIYNVSKITRFHKLTQFFVFPHFRATLNFKPDNILRLEIDETLFSPLL